MIFEIIRTSQWYDKNLQPHPKAFRFQTSWLVDVYDLDNLLALAKECDIIVSASGPLLEIYDQPQENQ